MNEFDFRRLSSFLRLNIGFEPFAPLAHSKKSFSPFPWFEPRSPAAGVGLGILLVSVPVFFEAPLVRSLPWVCLLLTGVWVWLGVRLCQRPGTQFWGDLLIGFGWSWLAGSIYWGWFRWEPFWHLPIEAIALPTALIGIRYGWGRVGHWFYLGSLLGTAITDLYFYRLHLMPFWRQMMVASPTETVGIMQAAMIPVQTSTGLATAAIYALVLLALAWRGWRSPHCHHWVFSGTLLGTLLVDSLFVGLAQF